MRARGRVSVVLIGVFLAFLLIGILHTPEETGALRVSLDFFVNPNHVPLVVCRELGLFAEEYDSGARRQTGNFPQALTHIALINTAHNLSAAKASSEKPAVQRSK